MNPPTPPSSPLTPAERRVAVTELIAAKALAPFFAAWTALVERDGAE